VQPGMEADDIDAAGGLARQVDRTLVRVDAD
jgi:hypothetical protein